MSQDARQDAVSDEVVDSLLEYATGRDVAGEDLDEAVHELHSDTASAAYNDGGMPELTDADALEELHERASQAAADVNNRGPVGQMRWLVTHCGEAGARALIDTLAGR